MRLIIYLLTVWVFSVGLTQAQKCQPRDDGHGSISCVCTGSFCDYPDPISVDQLSSGTIRVYTSTKAGLRLEPSDLTFSNDAANANVNFTIRRTTKYQEILGFGGAMTDAAGLDIAELSEAAQDNLFKAYFSPEGIGYSFIRVPIGGTDFSTRKYSYDDDHDGDTTLQFFALTEEDTKYKIPYLQKAIQMSTETPIKLFATSWSPPDWMKNISWALSSLKPEYYQVYTDYYIKFLQAYKQQNLNFWGVTLQNEPGNGLLGGTGWNSMGWYPEEQGTLIINNAGPSFAAQGFGDLKIMICDDQRTSLQEWTDKLLSNESVSRYVSGTALHWYNDNKASPWFLSNAHNQYPDKFILYTESCNFGIPSDSLGDWDKGQSYLHSIIEVTTNWVAGWVDWNLALNLAGGPNWYNNFVDAPIIVNAATDEFYKQPMFYAMAHVSKYVTPGSVRIALDTYQTGATVEKVAFERPDGVTVLLFLNTNEGEAFPVRLTDPDKGSVIINVEPKSFKTILYK